MSMPGALWRARHTNAGCRQTSRDWMPGKDDGDGAQVRSCGFRSIHIPSACTPACNPACSPTAFSTEVPAVRTNQAPGGVQIERAWALKFQMLSHSACPAIAAAITPRCVLIAVLVDDFVLSVPLRCSPSPVSHAINRRLAQRYGWRRAAYVYAAACGVFGLAWQLFARSKPEKLAAATAIAPSVDDDKGAAAEAAAEAAVSWRRQSIAVGCAHTVSTD